MANRFDSPYGQKYTSTYVPLPLDAISDMAKEQQLFHDKKVAEGLDIAGKQWNQLPSDLEYSKKAKQEIDNVINEFSSKNFSNPSVVSEWNKKRIELSNRFGPTGDIGNIQANFDSYKAYEKDILAKSKDLGWSSDELRSHLNNAKQKFSGTVKEDNSFNYFNGEGVSNYVDPNDWASKALKDVAADTGVEGLKRYSSLNQVTEAFKSGELEHKDYDKIMNSLAARAAGDSKLKASLEQEGLFKGQSGWSNFMKGTDDKGNVIPNTKTPFGNILSGIAYGAQYQKEKENYMKVTDPFKLYQLKKKSDEEDLQKHMTWTIQGIPTDPNNPTNNDAGINTVLKNTDTKLGDHWEFKDGKLVLKSKAGDNQSYVSIDGKDYTLDKLPEGYEAKIEQGAYMAGAGSSGSANTAVFDFKGARIPIKNRQITSDDSKKGYANIVSFGQRLGITGGKFDDYKEGVNAYLKEANNFQMNFTQFDEGTSASLSKAFGASINSSGEITNPGQLSFSTIKTLDGRPLSTSDLEITKAQILNHSKIIGTAKSLTNSNYKAGDMYLQGIDPDTKQPRVYIINSNNRDFNKANEASTRLTQSINNYIQTGQINNTKELEKLNKVMGVDKNPHKFVSVQQDSKGNVYASYVSGNRKDANGKSIIEFGVSKFDIDGTPIKMSLDEANKELDKDAIVPLLPNYNIKNFDRATKASEFDELINQNDEDHQ